MYNIDISELQDQFGAYVPVAVILLSVTDTDYILKTK